MKRKGDPVWKIQAVQAVGSGRTGTVWKAVHQGLNEYRAIKCVPKTHKDYEGSKKEGSDLKGAAASGDPTGL